LNLAGQCQVPALSPGLTYVEVAAGLFHTAALRSDGSIVCWGADNYGQSNVVALPPGLTYVGVAAGARHTVGRRSDGTLAAWGANGFGQCNVPANPAGVTCVQVAVGEYHTAALRSDGQVACWGRNVEGQCSVPVLAPGLSFVEVAAGKEHTVARVSDGTVQCWGENASGECDVEPLTGGLTYVDVAAGDRHTLARRSDGAVVSWGANQWGQSDAPVLGPGFHYAEIDGGVSYSVALVEHVVTSTYCTAGTTSHGCLASIGATGTPIVGAASGFTITASGVEGQRSGLIFYGVTGRNAQAWGNGGTSFLCVKPPAQRLGAQVSGGTTNACDGVLSQDWLAFVAAHPGALGAPFGAGQVLDAQAWFRDPPAIKSTSLSDALEFVLQP
jgi:large repetitive protein